MNIIDPVADMLTRIRNAAAAQHKTVDIPASKEKSNRRYLASGRLYQRCRCIG